MNHNESVIDVKSLSKSFHHVQAVKGLTLTVKKGEIFVNDMPIKEYFSQREQILTWVRPFHAIGVSHPPSKFSGTIKVAGGGKNGQVIAVQLGIARALLKYDESLKPLLKTGGFLTRDSRKVERKKYGHRKARKSSQYSKR